MMRWKNSFNRLFNPETKRPLPLRIAIWIAVSLVGLVVLGFVGFWILYAIVTYDVPDLDSIEEYNPPLTTRVFSQSGIVLAEFAVERRDVVPSSRIPPKLVQAFVASEDDNFFNHVGIDLMGIVRAAIKNMRAGRIVQGGSTITQQVAKSFVGREKTYTRKIKEAVLALGLESELSKEEILYLYLNQIYLGHGSYGVQAAARNYFRKNVWELDMGQMTTLAGLPQAPSLYDPVTRPEAALQRRRYVLERMQNVGYMDEHKAQEVLASPIDAKPIVDIFRQRAPYFTEIVRRQLQEKYETEGVYEAGLKVETTVDMDWQHSAQLAINRGLRQVDHRQGYRGALINIRKKDEVVEFLTAVQQQLPDGEIPEDMPVLAYVKKVAKNVVRLAIGHNRAVLPVMGMRWARRPDPTVHFKSEEARVQDARRVLKPGDVIVVQKVIPDVLMGGEPPEMRRFLPKNEELAVVKLDQIPAVQGALLSVEPRMGYVKAIIGGYNFSDSEFNRVLQACRQPGSSFKPIHYSLAIEEKGYNPSTILLDTAVIYDDPEHQNRWKPENFGSDFKGQVTLHTALTNSMNVPSIKVMTAVGIRRAIKWARKLGITTPLRKELGLALGSSCVKPWDLTKVYSVLIWADCDPVCSLSRRLPIVLAVCWSTILPIVIHGRAGMKSSTAPMITLYPPRSGSYRRSPLQS